MKQILFPSINEEKEQLIANKRENLCQEKFFANSQNEEIAGFRYV
jgi:hypothetical protein